MRIYAQHLKQLLCATASVKHVCLRQTPELHIATWIIILNWMVVNPVHHYGCLSGIGSVSVYVHVCLCGRLL